MAEHVTFSEEEYVGHQEGQSTYKSVVRHGVVVDWLVLPDDQMNAYGESVNHTDYTVIAVVRCTDGLYRTSAVGQLRHTND